jgi:CheY-like chemotaxis protein
MGGAERAAGTILVVDDDPAVLTIVSRMLERRGYSTHVAADGAAAEAILEGEEVDLIVADLRMPEMSGVELVRRARARRPQVAAIYMSGDAGELASLPGAEAAAALEKPFGGEQLLRAVDDALAGG